MSYYFSQISKIIDDSPSSKKELNDYYTEYAIEKLTSLKSPKHNAFLLLSDLKIHLQTNPYKEKKVLLHIIDKTDEYAYNFTNKEEELFKINENDDITNYLKDRLFYFKILHIRAIILDLIETDYSSDEQIFYKPEKWIYECIDEIENTFKDLNEFITEFNILFLQNCLDTFLSKNIKFGYLGNLLLINFIVYERWSQKYFQYNFEKFYSKIKDSFVEDRIIDRVDLEKIIDENN